MLPQVSDGQTPTRNSLLTRFGTSPRGAPSGRPLPLVVPKKEGPQWWLGGFNVEICRGPYVENEWTYWCVPLAGTSLEHLETKFYLLIRFWSREMDSVVHRPLELKVGCTQLGLTSREASQGAQWHLGDEKWREGWWFQAISISYWVSTSGNISTSVVCMLAWTHPVRTCQIQMLPAATSIKCLNLQTTLWFESIRDEFRFIYDVTMYHSTICICIYVYMYI